MVNERAWARADRRATPSARAMTGALAVAVIAILATVAAVAGCSTKQDTSKTPRTGVEQLLLTQAAERSLIPLSLPLPYGATVMVDPVALSGDGAFVQKLIEDRLARLGFRIPKKPEDATYRARVVIQSLGTDQGETFFGMPPVTSVLLPFALPELALYKNVHQKAMIRLSLDVHRVETGEHITTSPWYEATTFSNWYTWLLVFKSHRTDLVLPREAGLLVSN